MDKTTVLDNKVISFISSEKITNDLTNELKSITYSYSIYRIKHRKNDWY